MPITVTSAMRPGAHAPGEDRVRAGRDAVVVLDGASGTDTSVSVSDYVDQLANHLIDRLDDDQQLPLTHAVSDAIRSAVGAFQLMPGEAPSSTVSIARHAGDHVDLLVLGDSPIYLPGEDRFTDTRLADLDLPSRVKLFEHLAAGGGYDDTYRQLLRATSGEKTPYMNIDGGYWIAEAAPEAGLHARTRTIPAADLAWVILLTDGAETPMTHLGIDPAALAGASASELDELLEQLHRWEDDVDPHAHALPRYKTHDDKALAVVHLP